MKPSEKALPPPSVLVGLDIFDDMSPNSLSLPDDPMIFCEMAISLARPRVSIHSSTDPGVARLLVLVEDLGSSNV